jgi:hypothetical protein
MATRNTLSSFSAAEHSVAALKKGTANNGAVNFWINDLRVVIVYCLLSECKQFASYLQGLDL